MTALPTDGTALYGLWNKALTPNAPAWDGEAGMMAARSTFSVFHNLDLPETATAVDLTWALPVGPQPLPIPDAILAAVIAVLDGGGSIALAATCQEAILTAIDGFLPFLGGGRA